MFDILPNNGNCYASVREILMYYNSFFRSFEWKEYIILKKLFGATA